MGCDIVPCIRIGPGDRVRTAVDRTPLHSDYINSRLERTQREDVLLLKSFLKGIGAYGAEDTVNGFSGYLTELLIIRYRDFEGAASMFMQLGPSAFPSPGSEELGGEYSLKDGPLIMEVERGQEREPGPERKRDLLGRFDQAPFIVPDPVDDRRNVGSPVSLQTIALTVKAFCELALGPSKDPFHPFSRRPRPLTSGTKGGPGGLFQLPLPEGNPGIIMTQLRSALNKCLSRLMKTGFTKSTARMLLVFPSGFTIDQSYLRARYVWTSRKVRSPTALVKLATEPKKLDEEYWHWGPPADNARADDFRARWKDRTALDPKSGKLYTVLRREEADPERLLAGIWKDSVLPSHFTGIGLSKVEAGSPLAMFSDEL